MHPNSSPCSRSLAVRLRAVHSLTTQSRSPIAVRRRAWAQRGFTLLELLVVLMIIAVLASYVGPKVFSEIDKAKQKAATAQMKTLADAMAQYRLDVGAYPSDEEGLDALMHAPPDTPQWRGPYLERALPKDPWGHAYIWNNPAQSGDENAEVEIESLGADGRSGGSGIDHDLIHGF
jgi:general secretion pathway protein G